MRSSDGKLLRPRGFIVASNPTSASEVPSENSHKTVGVLSSNTESLPRRRKDARTPADVWHLWTQGRRLPGSSGIIERPTARRTRELVPPTPPRTACSSNRECNRKDSSRCWSIGLSCARRPCRVQSRVARLR